MGDLLNSLLTGGESKKLKCHVCEPPDCAHQNVCENAVMCYKSRIRDSVGVERISKGCISEKDWSQFLCSSHQRSKASMTGPNKNVTEYKFGPSRQTECCMDRDFCNEGEFPTLAPDILDGKQEPVTLPGLSDSEVTYMVVFFTFLVVSLLLGVVAFSIRHFRRSHKKRMNELLKVRQENCYQMGEDNLQTKPAGDSTLKEYIDGSMTSGSGSGLPLLIQRTLSKNIHLVECIGKGRFGEVWKGVWNCEHVAVKIFSTRDEASWIRETDIYSSVMLRHNNILGFYGSDMTSRNSATQLWLVTHYHRNGSLYDYLNKKSLTHNQLVKMSFSIANGLAFLHSEMVGTESRPGIAHRDLKSKNILVTSNETCVIADFGLSVTHKRDTGELVVFQNPKVGTRRYMAPEVLNDSLCAHSLNTKSFDAFKRVDMYAFGLVLWEMARRTVSHGIVEEYQPPFYDVVPSDPSFDEMRKVVCIDNYRPEMPNRWVSDGVLSRFNPLIKECWHQNPAVRLSALRVKKTLVLVAQSRCKGVLDDIIV